MRQVLLKFLVKDTESREMETISSCLHSFLEGKIVKYKKNNNGIYKFVRMIQNHSHTFFMSVLILLNHNFYIISIRRNGGVVGSET